MLKCSANCAFENIAPRVFETVEEGSVKAPRTVDTIHSHFKRLRVTYSKQGPAKYFGHLELSNILLRAIRRAGIPVKFSEGFHPKPRISFDDPLPVGLESLQEKIYLTVPDNVEPQDVQVFGERVATHAAKVGFRGTVVVADGCDGGALFYGDSFKQLALVHSSAPREQG